MPSRLEGIETDAAFSAVAHGSRSHVPSRLEGIETHNVPLDGPDSRGSHVPSRLEGIETHIRCFRVCLICLNKVHMCLPVWRELKHGSERCHTETNEFTCAFPFGGN